MGLVLLLGAAFTLNLTVLGAGVRTPSERLARQLFPWAAGGLAVVIATGIPMFMKYSPALVNIFSNGNASPSLSNPTASFTGYQDFRRTVPAPTIIRDSTYRISISQISGSGSWAGANGVAFMLFLWI